MEGKKLVHKLKEPFDAMYKMGVSNDWLRIVDDVRTVFHILTTLETTALLDLHLLIER